MQACVPVKGNILKIHSTHLLELRDYGYYHRNHRNRAIVSVPVTVIRRGDRAHMLNRPRQTIIVEVDSITHPANSFRRAQNHPRSVIRVGLGEAVRTRRGFAENTPVNIIGGADHRPASPPVGELIAVLVVRKTYCNMGADLVFSCLKAGNRVKCVGISP